MTYIPVIGLEIHVQPKTNSKMFCGCSADIFGAKPNTHTCPVCLGLPGALPVPNKRAVEATITLGLALGSNIAKESKFDRKNYFYPDLPKGYQISQYDQPIATGGALTVIDSDSGEITNVAFTRVHLEEDTGKLIHKDNYTLVDFNRSGMPLIEIVTEPDIRSVRVMKQFLRRLRLILRYAGVSDADMEKGTMRLEPNVSVAQVADGEMVSLPSYKVELKNINSFKFAERATLYEIERQIALLKKGEIPAQETRGWDENNSVTVSQRTKEEAHDYRYFPEPDIPPMYFSQEMVEQLSAQLPMLPAEYEEKFSKIGLPVDDIDTLLEKPELLSFAEHLLQYSPDGRAKEFIIKAINQPSVLSHDPSEFIQDILGEESTILSDENELRTVIQSVISAYPNEVERYKAGKHELFGFFMGKVMANTQGKASPQVAQVLLTKILSE